MDRKKQLTARRETDLPFLYPLRLRIRRICPLTPPCFILDKGDGVVMKLIISREWNDCAANWLIRVTKDGDKLNLSLWLYPADNPNMQRELDVYLGKMIEHYKDDLEIVDMTKVA